MKVHKPEINVEYLFNGMIPLILRTEQALYVHLYPYWPAAYQGGECVRDLGVVTSSDQEDGELRFFSGAFSAFSTSTAVHSVLYIDKLERLYFFPPFLYTCFAEEENLIAAQFPPTFLRVPC